MLWTFFDHSERAVPIDFERKRQSKMFYHAWFVTKKDQQLRDLRLFKLQQNVALPMQLTLMRRFLGHLRINFSLLVVLTCSCVRVVWRTHVYVCCFAARCR